MTLSIGFINTLPLTDKRIITKYQQTISKQILIEAKNGILQARQKANAKYGKGWRERLELKKIYI